MIKILTLFLFTSVAVYASDDNREDLGNFPKKKRSYHEISQEQPKKRSKTNNNVDIDGDITLGPRLNNETLEEALKLGELSEEQWNSIAHHDYPEPIVQKAGELLCEISLRTYSCTTTMLSLKYCEQQLQGQSLHEIVAKKELKQKGFTALKTKSARIFHKILERLTTTPNDTTLQYIYAYAHKIGIATQQGTYQKKPVSQDRISYTLKNPDGQKKEAFTYFEKSAKCGFVPSYYELGLCYILGLGTGQDVSLGISYFQRGSDAGHASSQWVYGYYILIRDQVDANLSSLQNSLNQEHPIPAHIYAGALLCLGKPHDEINEWIETSYDLGFTDNQEELCNNVREVLFKSLHGDPCTQDNTSADNSSSATSLHDVHVSSFPSVVNHEDFWENDHFGLSLNELTFLGEQKDDGKYSDYWDDFQDLI